VVGTITANQFRLTSPISASNYTGTTTNLSYTITDTDRWLYGHNGTLTVTLPDAETNIGRELTFKNRFSTSKFTSNTSSILNGTFSTTVITTTGIGHWTTLVSDGQFWIVMMAVT
jgi:hypothetical protein